MANIPNSFLKELDENTSQSIIYKRITGSYGQRENYQRMEQFKQWPIQKQLANEIKTKGIYGIIQDNPMTIPAEQCRYDLSLISEKKNVVDSLVSIGTLPGGTLLVFPLPTQWKRFKKIGKNSPFTH